MIKEVYPGSIAEEMEIEPGDVLLSINNEEIGDVFDYRYLIKDEYVEAVIRKPDGEEWLLEIDKEYDDDLGLEFENSLMSDYRSCSNKCIFCFIDQMPPGMRETLYFKDDDSRLSFLQGNYITLTNMKAVSYTHLDVYKRQALRDSLPGSQNPVAAQPAPGPHLRNQPAGCRLPGP